MLVSVIIPNYNHAIYLKKRIDSVLNQTFQEFELIILDDCSKDNSREIIENYRHHPKISHIIFNEYNSGSTFKQWEKGIELAIGEWIWIAESDDWCEPFFLQELLTYIKKDEDVVLAYCQSIVVSPENRILSKTQTNFLNEIINGKEFVKQRMLGVNSIVNASMTIFKKSCISYVPGDYKQMKYCGDWFFWVNICFQGSVHISGKYLNYYLRHDNNVATNAVKMGYDFLEGNIIYHYINSKLSVNQTDIENALTIRMNMYFNVKDVLNEQVRVPVYKSMLELHPDMKFFINNKVQKDKQQRLITSLKNIIKKIAS